MTSPQVFGPYELTERINIGGMAEVFRAKPPRASERLVAIKRILPSIAEDEEFIDDVHRRGDASPSQLDHPNIAQIYDLGRGRRQLLHRDGVRRRQGPARGLRRADSRGERSRSRSGLVLHVIADAAQGLDYAHNERDARGQAARTSCTATSRRRTCWSRFDGEVKIIDFGIAKAAGKARAHPGGHPQGQVRVHVSRAGPRAAASTGAPTCSRSASASGSCSPGERLFAGENEFVDHGEDPRSARSPA